MFPPLFTILVEGLASLPSPALASSRNQDYPILADVMYDSPYGQTLRLTVGAPKLRIVLPCYCRCSTMSIIRHTRTCMLDQISTPATMECLPYKAKLTGHLNKMRLLLSNVLQGVYRQKLVMPFDIMQLCTRQTTVAMQLLSATPTTRKA